jgi:catalase
MAPTDPVRIAHTCEVFKGPSAIDFVRDAFGHLKAIGIDRGGQSLLKSALVEGGAGVSDISDTRRFIAAAKTRHWSREASWPLRRGVDKSL